MAFRGCPPVRVLLLRYRVCTDFRRKNCISEEIHPNRPEAHAIKDEMEEFISKQIEQFRSLEAESSGQYSPSGIPGMNIFIMPFAMHEGSLTGSAISKTPSGYRPTRKQQPISFAKGHTVLRRLCSLPGMDIQRLQPVYETKSCSIAGAEDALLFAML